MNSNVKTILYAVGAFSTAGLLYLAGKRGDATAATTPGASATALQDWYQVREKPAAQTQAAINSEWAKLNTLFSSQPDFYI